ncbi:glycosyl hydrolase [Streptomyces cyaneofuscatus]|uniref:glycoside hydrolase family 26 protein n=1 Tax=Streptomyces TaxID=1883 RepID=UPI000F2052FF|nr:glycosyl hydrolase [Streptomyces sp. CBMAI 2042]RLV71222.1 Endoglucanase H/glycosyl hydrolase family 26 [Streptomyces sp. CBMAI 2042]
MPAKRRLITTCIAAAVLSLLAGGGIAGQLPPGTDSVDSAAPGPQGSRGAGSTAHGAYLDYGPAGVSRMADLSRWLGGAELRVGHTYLPGDLWVNIEGTPDFLDAWADWRKADEDRMFVLNVPMLERNEERVPDAQVRRLLRSGAAGDYDQHFTRLAERLVSLGVPDTVIVLGWEMNGTTYTHRCGPDPASWKAYWQRIVTAMRAVPGQEFRFDFTPSRGLDAVPWTACYPGDDVVDIIGMDSYDQPPGESFDDQINDPYGLQKHVDFAAERGKPISFPEWGLFRNGDNPEYMRRMLDWIDRHQPLYQTITDYCPHGVWQCKSNPRSSRVFRTKLAEMAAPVKPAPPTTAPSPTPSPTPPPTPTPPPVPTPTPTVPPAVQPSPTPSVQPTPTAPEAPGTRRWCVTVPFGDLLGPWLKERRICFRY